MKMPPGVGTAREVATKGDLRELIEESPYARSLGIVVEEAEDGVLCRMTYAEGLGGLGGLHGGTVSALLEVAATCELSRHAPRPGFRLVSLTVEFLRPGRSEDTLARACIVRQGRRVANLRIEAWQRDRSNLVATAQAAFLLDAE